jgi:signal transduction histidine kinase
VRIEVLGEGDRVAAKASTFDQALMGKRRLPPVSFMIETAALAVPLLGALTWYAVGHSASLWTERWELVAWVGALSILNLLDVPAWRGQPLIADVPLLLGMAVLFPPGTGAVVAFVGSSHTNELHDLESLIRAINNRSTTAIGVFLAGLVAHALQASTSLHIGIIVAFAWLVWTAENYLAVSTGISLFRRIAWRASFSRLWPANLYDYLLVVTVWMVLVTLLSSWYNAWGIWALVFTVVVSLALRQTLVRSETSARERYALEQQSRLVGALTARVASERKDERLRVASALHDEVIPALFNLSLHGQVLKRDLERHRLDDLKRDVDELLEAANACATSVRDVVHDLRSSPVGVRGMANSLQELASELRTNSDSDIRVEIVGSLDGVPERLELLLYQVTKEALTNAVRHSRARTIRVRVKPERAAVVLEVEDDGIGFDPLVVKDQHFGLLIMQERAASEDGSLDIDSKLGSGTVVTACFPTSPGASSSPQ